MSHPLNLEIAAPAKINLFLAITGRRPDGFHDLVSVAAPLAWGDTLDIRTMRPGEGKERFALDCDEAAVPLDETNLVLKAAQAFAAATGWKGSVRFALRKRIPMSAGLGGGSSDAAAALMAVNRLAGDLLDPSALASLAAQVGSDCPLFLHPGPVVMRGRGERLEPLPQAAAARLRGLRVLVFKPGFGIPTAWAYGRLAAVAPRLYVPAAEAEARIRTWIGDSAVAAERLLFNSMEGPAFEKFLALPALLGQLARKFGLAPRMSGSGSACFALLPEEADAAPIGRSIREAWGKSALVLDTRIA